MDLRETLKDRDELVTYLNLSGVEGAEAVADDVLARGRSLADFYGGLPLAPLLGSKRFAHTFAVVPLEDYSLAFSIDSEKAGGSGGDPAGFAVERSWSKDAVEGEVNINGVRARVKTLDERTVALLIVAGDAPHNLNNGATLEDVRRAVGNHIGGESGVGVPSPEYLYALSLVSGLNLPLGECRRLLGFGGGERGEREPLSGFCKIVRVREVGGARFALLYRGWYNDFQLKVYTPNDPNYEYIDEGNYISHGHFGDWNNKLTVVLIFDPFELNAERVGLVGNIAERLARRASGEGRDARRPIVIGHEAFEREVQLREAEERMRKAKEREEKAQEDAVGRRLAEGGFTLRGMRFEGCFITYQGQKIGVEGVPISHLVNTQNLQDESFDFNAAYSRFIGLLFWGRRLVGERYRCVKDHGFRGEYLGRKIWVGSFPVTVTQKARGAGTVYLVNGVRLGRADLRTPEGSEYGDAERRADGVIDRALCFNSAESYGEFLNAVKAIPLRAHDLLVNGALASVEDHDRQTGGRVTEKFAFKVVRDGQKYYFKLGDKLVHIRGGFNEIIRLARSPDWRRGAYSSPMEIYRELLPLVGDENTAVELVRDARREFVNTIARAKQLLKETLERFGDRVQKATVEHQGRRYEGYAVRGKMRSYFVDEATNKVFEHPSMNPFCIVEKTGREMNRLDQLITRIYALLNDSAVAGEVHTLR